MRKSLLFLLCVCGTINACADANVVDQPRMCFKDGKDCFDVEVVSKPKDMEIGLQGRNGLNQKGMLFNFVEDGRYRFWMKSMRFSLDIIWIDVNSRIVHIASNVPPCTSDPCPTYFSEQNARMVLEVPAGTTESHNVKVGDVIQLTEK